MLPAVLAVVGVVALVLLATISALHGLTREARAAVQRASFQQTALSLEADAAFLAASTPMNDVSLALSPTPVALDGQLYEASAASRTFVSLQDEGGLVNLDGAPPQAFERLLIGVGAPPASAGVLVDRLADYVDPDDLKRADGAEAEDYLLAGQAPPPNVPLRRADQLHGILGWRDLVSSQQWSRLRDLVTVDPTTGTININTASAEVLEAQFGLTPEQAASAAARRARTPFVSLEDLGRSAGVALVGDAERVYTFPSGRFALRVVDASTGWTARARIVLTPQDPDRPVWVEERSLQDVPPAQRPDLPLHAPVFPEPFR
jgi:type II secretory pathway component PulK